MLSESAHYLVAVPPADVESWVERIISAGGQSKSVNPAEQVDDVESRPDVHHVGTGLSAGAAVGIGLGVATAVLIPPAGVLALSAVLASTLGFGSAGAAVGGMLGAMSDDNEAELTAAFNDAQKKLGRVVLFATLDSAVADRLFSSGGLESIPLTATGATISASD